MLADVPFTVELFHNVRRLVLYCTLVADTLVVLIHTQSVHVRVIVHATHHEIHVLVGVHHVHDGHVTSSQAVPLSVYPGSHVHLAYKLDGAVDHVVTGVVRDELEYHPLKIECALLGVQSDLISFHSTMIDAHVHPFGWIVDTHTEVESFKQRTRKLLLRLRLYSGSTVILTT